MYKNKNSLNRRQKIEPNSRRLGWIIGGVAVLAIIGFVIVVLAKHKPPVDQTVVHTTANSETKGEPSEPANTGGQPSQSSTNTNTTTDQSSDSGSQKPSQDGTTGSEPLVAPSGNFVSSHKVTLGSQPTLQSVCVTTPGANCRIIFTLNGTTKALSTQTADRGGAVYWTWRPQELGLTQGSWTITAEASQNGQTKTSNDALTLDVTP